MADFENMMPIYFDGKKAATRVMMINEKTNKLISWLMEQDHHESGNEYLTHATPKSGQGKQIVKIIHEFLVEKNLTYEPIVCW